MFETQQFTLFRVLDVLMISILETGLDLTWNT